MRNDYTSLHGRLIFRTLRPRHSFILVSPWSSFAPEYLILRILPTLWLLLLDIV